MNGILRKMEMSFLLKSGLMKRENFGGNVLDVESVGRPVLHQEERVVQIVIIISVQSGDI